MAIGLEHQQILSIPEQDEGFRPPDMAGSTPAGSTFLLYDEQVSTRPK
jgi:hypothetical protein